MHSCPAALLTEPILALESPRNANSCHEVVEHEGPFFLRSTAGQAASKINLSFSGVLQRLQQEAPQCI